MTVREYLAVVERSVIVVVLVWSAYYLLHSLLAMDRAKAAVRRHWPRLAPWYRLSYNAIAVLLLPVPLAALARHQGETLWRWTGTAAVVANGAAILAVLAFLASLSAYDLRAFLGLRAESSSGETRGGQLSISFFHRFVRHPWYFFGLVILWSRPMDRAFLAVALVTTLYLVVGSRLEENRLILEHGERYLGYRRAVAGLLPLPWKILSTAGAQELERSSS